MLIHAAARPRSPALIPCKVTLSAVDLAVFVSYLLAVGIIAALATRSAKKTRREYLLGGDKMPWWMIGGSIVAAN